MLIITDHFESIDWLEYMWSSVKHIVYSVIIIYKELLM